MIKCIGCFELLRRNLGIYKGQPMVVYQCSRFPYGYYLRGLLRPQRILLGVVEDCPEDPLGHCAVCQDTKIIHYGQDIVSICKEHDAAWGKYLDDDQRRAYLAPRGRPVKSKWVEIFREFVEDIRNKKER